MLPPIVKHLPITKTTEVLETVYLFHWGSHTLYHVVIWVFDSIM